MRVSIHDREALLAVSPGALSAYARSVGWTRHEPYRMHSDVYIGEQLPEVIVPRTERLGDYASVVASLIKMFATVARQDEMTVYRSLVTADRDVIRVRAGESEDGSIGLNHGVDLISGARDMLLAAACSLGKPKAVYRAGANRDAADLLERICLGQTDQGSFVVTLVTPVIPVRMSRLFSLPDDQDSLIERRLTLRLMEALAAARHATERTAAGDEGAFAEVPERGVSANLCEALVQIIEAIYAAGHQCVVGTDPTGDDAATRCSVRPGGRPSPERSRPLASGAGAAAGRSPHRLRSAPDTRGGRRGWHNTSGHQYRRERSIGHGAARPAGLRTGGSGP